MKLEPSLPEKPGWIFVTPGFDFVLLLLALVMLTGVVARESLVEVELPSSEFRGLRMGDENFVVITVRSGQRGPIYYVAKERTEAVDLESVIAAEAKELNTKKVSVQCDQQVELGVEQSLIDLVSRLDLRYFRVIRPSEEKGE